MHRYDGFLTVAAAQVGQASVQAWPNYEPPCVPLPAYKHSDNDVQSSQILSADEDHPFCR